MQKYWIIFASFLLLSLGHVPSSIATATDNGDQEMGFAVDEMSLSQVGVNHICNFEGLRLSAYDDGIGVWALVMAQPDTQMV